MVFEQELKGFDMSAKDNDEDYNEVKKHAAEERRRNKFTIACVIVASMISLLLGYDTGVMSGANLFIKQDLKITDVQVEILAGILNICALFGSLTAGGVSDWIGRRYTICLSSLIFFAGSALMGLAPSYPVLLSGRCVAGLGVGYALMIAPVYSAEISDPKSRGSLTSLPEICISLGILIGYVSNFGFAKLPLKYGWRVMLGLGSLPSLCLAMGIFMLPESPRWLAMRGRDEEAKSVLVKVCNTKEEADERFREIEEVRQTMTTANSVVGKGVWKEFFLRPTAPVKRILITGIGIHFFQHVTGIEAVVLYSPRIFKAAGLATKNKLLGATIGVGATKTCFIFVATFLIDRVGRKPLLLTSLAGMTASLVALAVGLTIEEQHAGEKITWVIALCLLGVFSFIAFYSIGLGPITWVYSSEIYPSRLRAQGASLGVAVNRLMNATISMSFISLYQAITIGGSFFLFAGMGIVAWVFFFLLMPETRGKSMEEMEEVFGRRWINI